LAKRGRGGERIYPEPKPLNASSSTLLFGLGDVKEKLLADDARENPNGIPLSLCLCSHGRGKPIQETAFAPGNPTCLNRLFVKHLSSIEVMKVFQDDVSN
jgi:hypothetical protein